MNRSTTKRQSRVYQTAVTIIGTAAWAASVVSMLIRDSLPDQLLTLALVPLLIVVSRFVHIFRLPSGLKFSDERLSFSFSDALVLLVACWHGPVPALFLAGIEGFATSRRGVRRLSSNLFSLGMMSLTAVAASAALRVVLVYGFNEAPMGKQHHTLLAVAVAMLVASICQITVNMTLLSTLLALRHTKPILRECKEKLLWTAPMFLPTSTAASLMFLALQFNFWITLVIGAPIFLAIYFGHKQFSNSVQQRVEFMEKSHRETIEALAVTINAKDEVTHEHVLRVQIYATGVARLLGCTQSEIEALKAGALLHDIGKIAVPDHILNKPGKLSAEEFDKMKAHTLVGAQILSRVEFPYPVVPLVRSHHERWDGQGYPDGLRGEAIPLTARIISVVDCFDAVREDRPYRKGMTREAAVGLIMQGSGTQYDPRVVGIFVRHLPEFEAEVQAARELAVPNFGIEIVEQLSEVARHVAPAAGLQENTNAAQSVRTEPSNEELRALYHLAQALGDSQPDQIIAAFTDKLRLIVPYDSCAITSVVEGTNDKVVTHAAGEHASRLLNRRIAANEGVTGWVIANRTAFSNTDPKLDLPASFAEDFADYRTLLISPILKGREMHGTVTLYSSTLAAYTAEHTRLLEEAVTLLAASLSTSSDITPSKTESRLAVSKSLPAATIADFDSRQADEPALQSELTH